MSLRYDVLDDAETIVKLYNEENKSIKALGKLYNCDERLISKILKNNNVNIRKGRYYNKIYHINEAFFDTIDTEEKAYILGFLYADGSSNGVDRFSINLAIYDRDILEKIRKALESNAPIKIKNGYKIKNTNYTGAPTASLTIHNTKLCQRLQELGVIQKKTYILDFPEFIPENLIPHFVRGYFDGDGTITRNRKGEPRIGLISTRRFLEKLQLKMSFLEKPLPIQGRKKLNENIGIIDILDKEAVRKFCEWVYKDANIYCERKYNRYYSYYFLGEFIEPYPKRTEQELMELYGYEDIPPVYE